MRTTSRRFDSMSMRLRGLVAGLDPAGKGQLLFEGQKLGLLDLVEVGLEVVLK